jgi:hypothetical protein
MQNFAELIREILSNLIQLLRNTTFQLSFKILTEVVKVSKSENILFLPGKVLRLSQYVSSKTFYLLIMQICKQGYTFNPLHCARDYVILINANEAFLLLIIISDSAELLL